MQKEIKKTVFTLLFLAYGIAAAETISVSQDITQDINEKLSVLFEQYGMKPTTETYSAETNIPISSSLQDEREFASEQRFLNERLLEKEISETEKNDLTTSTTVSEENSISALSFDILSQSMMSHQQELPEPDSSRTPPVLPPADNTGTGKEAMLFAEIQALKQELSELKTLLQENIAERNETHKDFETVSAPSMNRTSQASMPEQSSQMDTENMALITDGGMQMMSGGVYEMSRTEPEQQIPQNRPTTSEIGTGMSPRFLGEDFFRKIHFRKVEGISAEIYLAILPGEAFGLIVGNNPDERAPCLFPYSYKEQFVAMLSRVLQRASSKDQFLGSFKRKSGTNDTIGIDFVKEGKHIVLRESYRNTNLSNDDKVSLYVTIMRESGRPVDAVMRYVARYLSEKGMSPEEADAMAPGFLSMNTEFEILETSVKLSVRDLQLLLKAAENI